MKHLYVKLQSPVVEIEVVAKDVTKIEEKVLVGFKRYELKESNKKLEEYMEYIQEDVAENADKLNRFITNEVVYLKNVKLDIEDNGIIKELSIEDTRKAVPVEELWATPEECLAAILDSFLLSAPWRLPFITTLQKAFYNVDLSGLEVKN